MLDQNWKEKHGVDMRVMVIASGDLWAGAEVMLYQLITGLAGNPDVELRVILFNRAKLALELMHDGVQVDVIDESRHSFFSLIWKTRKIVEKFSPEVIHSHRYKENLAAWLVGGWKKKVKLIATQHGLPETGSSVKNWLRTCLSFQLLGHCFDRTVVVSAEMKRVLVGSYGFADDDLSVIHNGIAIPAEVVHQECQCCVVGSAGRFFPVKDFSLFVEVAHQLLLECDGINFILAGEGPERKLLERKVCEYGLEDNFTFAGNLNNMDAFFRGVDIYLNTSIHEGIPMSILEAMACEIPVIAPNVGGFAEIIEDGVTGYLLPERSPAQYVGRIKRLLKKKQRLVMGKAARKHIVCNFSSTTMVQKYYQLYQHVYYQ